MKLKEIATPTTGTYVGVKMDEESCNKIVALYKELNLPDTVAMNKLHSTIIYSRTPAVGLTAASAKYPIEAAAIGFEIFDTQDKKRALVLKLDCAGLVDRHNEIMSEYATTYDFPAYIPHITLSYDCGESFDIDNVKCKLPKIVFISEYVEDLVLDWQNKKD